MKIDDGTANTKGGFSIRKNTIKLLEAMISDAPYRCPQTGSALIRKNYIYLAKMNVLFLLCGGLAWKLGNYLGSIGQDRVFTWRTPKAFGQNSRGPIFPYQVQPYFLDFEERIKFFRRDKALFNELILMHNIQKFAGFFHPMREDSIDSTIYDAEWEADAKKRMNEQRHEMAIKCVELGIYKDIYEAN